jgi:hypothetical protein
MKRKPEAWPMRSLAPAALLRIDASPRADDRSHSLQFTTRFEEVWRDHNPSGRVMRRDLRRELPPHVDQAWIEAAFTADDQRAPAMRQAIAASDALVDELFAVDEYVLGVPGPLKTWVDNVVRVGRKFLAGDKPFFLRNHLTVLDSADGFDLGHNGLLYFIWDTFQTLAARDSFDPTDARLTSTHSLAG